MHTQQVVHQYSALSLICTMEMEVVSIDGLTEIAKVLTQKIEDGYKLILLTGDLGSGKTTLSKVLCAQLGVTEAVSSPTFSLVNEYPSDTHGLIYHMDLYRLEKEDDLVQIGLEEYLDSGHLCLIEWPEIAIGQIIIPYVLVKILVGNHNIRIFNITTHDAMDT